MLTFYDHRADRVSVGEFNFHWIDVPQVSLHAFTRCLADDGHHPNPGTFPFSNTSGQRINQSVEHGNNSHLGAIAGTEHPWHYPHEFHRFHGTYSSPDGVVGVAAGLQQPLPFA